MLISRTLITWVATLGALAPSHVFAALLSCSANTPTELDRRQQLSANASFTVAAPQRIWLEIDEDGRALAISGANAALVLPSPPRLARHGFWIEPGTIAINVRDAFVEDLPVRFRARVFCAESDQRAAQMQRFSKAASVATSGRIETTAADALLTDLATVATSGDTEISAYAVHLSAQVKLMAGRSADAAAAFEQAEQTWRGIGDTARATAARVAWAEEAYSLGRYDAAMNAAESLPPQLDGALGYYAARLINVRCLGLKYRGERGAAAACYGVVVGRLLDLADPLELANTQLNLGGLQRDLGQLTEAEQSVAAAEKFTSSGENQRMPAVDVAMVRGRMRLLRADLSLRRGAIAQAMADYDKALAEFELAKAPRWRANTLIQLAAMYGRIGAYPDAYAVWSHGFSLYKPAEAPGRIASALMVLARIQREEGNPLRAAWLATMANSRFIQLGTPAEREAAQLIRARALTDAGDVARADAELVLPAGSKPLEPSARQLALAAAALAHGRPQQALSQLDTIVKTTSISERLDLEVLRARALHDHGRAAMALQQLRDTRSWLDQATQHSGNRLLRLLLQRQASTLGRYAMDWTLDDAADHDAIAEAVRWQGRLPLQPATGATAPAQQPDQQFDILLARELLLGQRAAGSDSSGALAAIFGEPEVSAAAAIPELTVNALQATLQPFEALMVLVEGNERTAVLLISNDSARLLPAVPTAQLRRHVQSLALTLKSPLSETKDIAAQSRTLAAQLWPDGLPARGWKRLYVVASPLADGIPWALLPDESGASLVESTAVSLVHLGTSGTGTPLALPQRMTLALAPQSSSTVPMLAQLGNAASEAQLIAKAGVPWTLDVFDASQAPIKAELLAALARPGAWLHIAAHGTTRAGYVGRSGIWLDAATNETMPSFLSVLDLFDTGVAAELVVLNACELGGGDTQAPGALAFADTMVQLGARHAVAALTPISDGAAKLWVPAFYAAMASTGDPAVALRQAQQALAQSRAYRHPFYWASLVHLQQLRLEAGH